MVSSPLICDQFQEVSQLSEYSNFFRFSLGNSRTKIFKIEIPHSWLSEKCLEVYLSLWDLSYRWQIFRNERSMGGGGVHACSQQNGQSNETNCRIKILLLPSRSSTGGDVIWKITPNERIDRRCTNIKNRVDGENKTEKKLRKKKGGLTKKVNGRPPGAYVGRNGDFSFPNVVNFSVVRW